MQKLGQPKTAIEGERMESFCKVNTSSQLGGDCCFGFLRSTCTHRQRRSMARAAESDGLEHASLPLARARGGAVAQGGGFQN